MGEGFCEASRTPPPHLSGSNPRSPNKVSETETDKYYNLIMQILDLLSAQSDLV